MRIFHRPPSKAMMILRTKLFEQMRTSEWRESRLIVAFYFFHLASYLNSYLAFYNVSLDQFCRTVGASFPAPLYFECRPLAATTCFHDRHHFVGSTTTLASTVFHCTRQKVESISLLAFLHHLTVARVEYPNSIPIKEEKKYPNTFSANNFHLVPCLASNTQHDLH